MPYRQPDPPKDAEEPRPPEEPPEPPLEWNPNKELEPPGLAEALMFSLWFLIAWTSIAVAAGWAAP